MPRVGKELPRTEQSKTSRDEPRDSRPMANSNLAARTKSCMNSRGPRLAKSKHGSEYPTRAAPPAVWEDATCTCCRGNNKGSGW